jgi:hypothetical protein
MLSPMNISAFLIALSLASPVLASDLVPIYQISHIYTADEPLSLAEQAAASAAHARRTYERIIADGGCEADVNTFEYASFCGARPFGYPMGSTGD